MIFKPKKVVNCWDTWVQYHEGTYYLFYLAGRMEHWTGFGVATSKDGLHFEDHGQVLTESEKNIGYLGTGSVWRSPDRNENAFFCNYSEHHKTETGVEQKIFFAKSYDLLSWEKMGEESCFPCDNRWYVGDLAEGGRWDCIYAIEKEAGGYYGYFTAKVKGRLGFGFAETEDGYHWTALEPPVLELDDRDYETQVEVGAICKYEGKYYIILSNGSNPGFIAVADKPEGPFRVQKENRMLMSSGTCPLSSYFMRFFQTPEGIFVNHHAISDEKNAIGESTISLAPIKKVWFDRNNTLFLRWWDANEGMKGEELPLNETGAEIAGEGFVLEGLAGTGGVVEITVNDGSKTQFVFDLNRDLQIKTISSDAVKYGKTMPRPFWGSENFRVRLLVRRRLTELYVNDYFVDTYTMDDCPVKVCVDGDWKEAQLHGLALS